MSDGDLDLLLPIGGLLLLDHAMVLGEGDFLGDLNLLLGDGDLILLFSGDLDLCLGDRILRFGGESDLLVIGDLVLLSGGDLALLCEDLVSSNPSEFLLNLACILLIGDRELEFVLFVDLTLKLLGDLLLLAGGCCLLICSIGL